MIAEKFRGDHWEVQTVLVFGTQPVFDTLLDNLKTIGFVNSKGSGARHIKMGRPRKRLRSCLVFLSLILCELYSSLDLLSGF